MKHRTTSTLLSYLAILCISFFVMCHKAMALTVPHHLEKLDNGLQILVLPNHKVPVISHTIWYKVGAIDEPSGQSGIAHFLEHLMFKGTENLESGEFSTRVARNGGEDNAFTSYDYTAYYQKIAADKLPMVMEMEADRMTGLILDKDEVLTERDVVLEERRTRIDRHPRNILLEIMRNNLFQNHPYQIPLIGFEHEIKTLNADHAKAFYQRYYAPNNAVLVIAGDVTAAKAMQLAQQYYGSIPARDIRRLNKTKEPSINAKGLNRQMTLTTDRVKTPELIRYYQAPSMNEGVRKHVYALEILSRVIGGSQTSHLYRRLVLDKKIAVSVEMGYDGVAKGPGILTLYVIPASGVDIETIQQAVDEELQDIITNGVDEKAIERAKNILISEAIYAQDGVQSLAHIYGRVLVSDLPISYIEQWEENIQQVTAAQIQAAAAYLFQKEKSVTGILQPTHKQGDGDA